MRAIKRLFVMAMAIVCCSFAHGAGFYEIKCTYRVLSPDLDILRSDAHGEDICGPIFAKTREIGVISDDIKAKYKPSDYVLTFTMDQIHGGLAAGASLSLKRKSDGKSTKVFAIMFDDGDDPWDMHTLGLNSLIALGQTVNYMSVTCDNDPKCDLFNANVGLVRRTIHSKHD